MAGAGGDGLLHWPFAGSLMQNVRPGWLGHGCGVRVHGPSVVAAAAASAAAASSALIMSSGADYAREPAAC
eukprot:SAG22_NODE_9601_length_580_cov_0.646570_2_plen_70_part_01